jgi:antitoxin VapB
MYMKSISMYIALHIQDPETDQLARQLSAATGETITQAVNTALRERLRAVSSQCDEEEYVARIKQITEPFSKLPILDNRSEDEILGVGTAGTASQYA